MLFTKIVDLIVGEKPEKPLKSGIRVEPTLYPRYQVRSALKTGLESLREDVKDHQKDEPRHTYQLSTIDFYPQCPDSIECVRKYFNEFEEPATRRSIINKYLRDINANKQIVVAEKFDFILQNSELDNFQYELNRDIKPSIRIDFKGEWILLCAPSSDYDPQKPYVILHIRDGKATDVARTETISKLPVVIGRNTDVDIQISGTYVSGRHLELQNDTENLLVQMIDLGSKNGTFVNSNKLVAGKPVILKKDDIIRLGTTNLHQSYADYPEIRIEFLFSSGSPDDSVCFSSKQNKGKPTPIWTSDTNLGRLKIRDSNGVREVIISKLPFSIGRSSTCDVCIPEANGAVSREHLVIEKIENNCAYIHNKAELINGTQVAGQEKPQRFVIPFGVEMVLAKKHPKFQPVTINILSPFD